MVDPRHQGRNPDLESGGIILTVNFSKRVAQNLRRIVLLWTSNFTLGKQQNHYFHDFEIFGRVHDSQNQLFLILETPNGPK